MVHSLTALVCSAGTSCGMEDEWLVLLDFVSRRGLRTQSDPRPARLLGLRRLIRSLLSLSLGRHFLRHLILLCLKPAAASPDFSITISLIKRTYGDQRTCALIACSVYCVTAHAPCRVKPEAGGLLANGFREDSSEDGSEGEQMGGTIQAGIL